MDNVLPSTLNIKPLLKEVYAAKSVKKAFETSTWEKIKKFLDIKDKE